MEKATHTKDAQTEKKSNQNVLIAKDHMLQTIKGVQLIKKQVFRQHVFSWVQTLCFGIAKASDQNVRNLNYIYLKENNFDIVALNETFLTKKIDFKIQGYMIQ